MEVTIEEIIQGFKACSFADLGGAIPYMKDLFTNNLPDQATPDEEIKKIIVEELKALQKAIPEHFHDEFMILPGRDGSDIKHGHWMVLHWILSKWYQSAKGPADVPKWYMDIVQIVPKDIDRGNKMCSDVILKILEVLEN